MTTARAAATLLGKELRCEFRARQLLNTTVVFVLVVVALFSFSFDPTDAEARRYAPGLLWIAFLFAGSLMLHPSFAREQTNDTIYALRLAPVEPFAILLGKILANFLFLMLAELLLLPIFGVLYNLRLVPVLDRLLLVLALGTLGITVTGTAFSAISAQARIGGLLLPLLLFSVVTPVLLASTEATAALLSEAPELPGMWTAFLVGFNVVFLTVTWLSADFLLEE